MSAPLVLVERDGPVAVVTMNRPSAMNALSRALQADLARAFRELEADASVRAVVLTGAGDRAFTAGLDLREVGRVGLSGGPGTEGARRETDPVVAMHAMSKPIIGAINGVAVTGGFEVALACDVLVASTNARFADTHVRVGVTPGWLLSQRLSRLIGISRAKELSFTGNYIDAQTALAWGLVNRVVPPAELLPLAKKLAADMASTDPDMLRRYKRLIDDGFDLPFGEARKLEAARAAEDNKKVTAESVESRRVGIKERGRSQKL
ncbi:enoyl-CoA hydratase/isomerase family protein [Hyaloraphidium curvatum]|nr:enoyl-CoA hydratase/isomerase family protein [Hyaloraphidium curvatum]